MRTAIISDLHLAALSGEDLLSERSVREALFAELQGAERLVLLGDTLELRDLPLADALEHARPFFEELGEALGDAEVVLVPGNHDHRLAEPLLERRALARDPALALEQRYRPAPAAQRIDRWLGSASLELSYPGVWFREDAYGMHGHYLDCHLTLPRLECLAAAAIMRATGPIPDPATPDDYERVLRPVYGFTFGLAQSGAPRLAGGTARPSERAYRWVGGDVSTDKRPGRAAAALLGGAVVPGAVWVLNWALRSKFEPDVSARAISRGGIRASREMVQRLQIGAEHVITGHTHRVGPRDARHPWTLPGHGQLHNTGSWIFSKALCAPGAEGNPFWPGAVTWLDGHGPPRRVATLGERDPAELAEVVRRLRASRR